MNNMSHLSVETLQTQLQSARKSILFMETQHADTLKDLHAEIQNLQKKCSKLTFEAAMREGQVADEMSEVSVKQLKADVSDLTNEKVRMLQMLEKKDRQFVELENHALIQEKKYLNELKVKNHRINALSNELESRSNTIGCLTAQLHQARSKLHYLAKQSHSPSVTPVPPNQPKSTARFHRSSKSTDANFRPQSSSSKIIAARPLKICDPVLLARPSSASSISAVSAEKLQRPVCKSGSRFSPSPMPDPTPFLNAVEGSDAFAKVRPPQVLPPISRRATSVQDANGNLVTSHSVPNVRDDKCERYKKPEELAFRRCNAALSSEQDVKGGTTRAPVSDGAAL